MCSREIIFVSWPDAGASLESLAKGGVQFSRRFTVEELQDRWYSLLYDPVVSEQASGAMIGLELSAATFQSKVIKLEKATQITCSSTKREAENLRKCYYAMHKRICTEVFGANLVSTHGLSNFEDGECAPLPNEEHLQKESPLSSLFEREGLDNEGTTCLESIIM